jgi:hypothetical protein
MTRHSTVARSPSLLRTLRRLHPRPGASDRVGARPLPFISESAALCSPEHRPRTGKKRREQRRQMTEDVEAASRRWSGTVRVNPCVVLVSSNQYESSPESLACSHRLDTHLSKRGIRSHCTPAASVQALYPISPHACGLASTTRYQHTPSSMTLTISTLDPHT